MIIFIFILLVFFISVFLLSFKSIYNIKKNQNNLTDYSKCIKFMDNNWDIFESRFGSLTDDMIRKHLFPLIKEMSRELTHSQCIYDIGGNVGDITKMFNEYYPQNKIFTVEPLIVNYRELKKKFNNIENITLFNVALGSFNGVKKSHTFGNGNVGDYLYPGRLLNEYEIEYMKIDDFYKKYCIFFEYNFSK